MDLELLPSASSSQANPSLYYLHLGKIFVLTHKYFEWVSRLNHLESLESVFTKSIEFWHKEELLYPLGEVGINDFFPSIGS